MASKDNWKSILKSHYADILCALDVTPSLAHEISIRCNLSKLQTKSLCDGLPMNRAKYMLSLLDRGDFKRYMAFYDALDAMGESALVERWRDSPKIWKENPATNRESRSISSQQLHKLFTNWNDIIADVDIGSVIPLIINDLTPYQNRCIMDKTNDVEKTVYLLKLMETGDQQLYNNIVKALYSSNQGHIAVNYFVLSD